jgi:hypothetical protein
MPAGHPEHGGGEGRRRLDAQRVPHHRCAVVLAQRVEPELLERLRQLVQRKGLVRIRGGTGGGEHERHLRGPARDEPEPAQRRGVAPVQIVDDEEERRPRGEPEHRPVEPVQRGCDCAARGVGVRGVGVRGVGVRGVGRCEGGVRAARHRVRR